MLVELYDFYSSIVVLSSVLIGFTIGKTNILRTLLIVRDIAIPIGISGTLIGFVAMLSSLSEPITLFPAMKVALLTTFYGVSFSLFIQPIIHNLQQKSLPTKAEEVSKLQVYFAVLIYFIVILMAISMCSEVASFIYFEAFSIVCFLPWLMTRCISDIDNQRIEQGSIYTLVAAFCAILIACLILLGNTDDLTRVGPTLALAYLGFLYGTVIFVINTIRYHATSGKSLPFACQGNFGLILTLFAIIIPVNFFLLSFEMNTTGLQRVKDAERTNQYQNDLLRKLTAHAVPTKEKSVTIISDEESWVFIDGKYTGPTPLFEVQLDKGEHFVQITVCSNEWLIKNGPGVSWEDYFSNATSGNCEYADTPEKIKMLVANGYAIEKQIGEHDGITKFILEYTPKYNPCCSVEHTKEFTVDITDDGKLYSWSFAQNKWLVSPKESTSTEPSSIDQ